MKIVGKFDIIKFSTGNNKTVYMFKLDDDYIVEVIDELTNKVVLGEGWLAYEVAEMLYNRCCYEYGIGEDRDD